MNKEYLNDLRLILIDKEGKIDIIFSADDQSNKNSISLETNKSINSLFKEYELFKNNTYKKDDFGDKHLFYLKQYINDNNINVPGVDNIKDDLLLYYYMAINGYLIIVNSSEHMNIIITPNGDINDEQKRRLIELKDFFTDDIVFSYVNNMHIERFESNGKTYGTLDIGETKEGNYKSILENLNTTKKAK